MGDISKVLGNPARAQRDCRIVNTKVRRHPGPQDLWMHEIQAVIDGRFRSFSGQGLTHAEAKAECAQALERYLDE